MGWRQVRIPRAHFDDQPGDCFARHGSHCRIAAVKQQWTSGRILLAQASPTPFIALLRFFFDECCWIHEEDDSRGHVPDRILCWQHHRTANNPAGGCAALCFCGGNNHRLLWHVFVHSGLCPLLLRLTEQEEGADQGSARVREVGEPGVA